MSGTEKYPVDVCYMVADLKYSAKQGVKICEIQQASLSMFKGDTFRNPEEASIHKQLLKVLSSYNKNGWVVSEGIADVEMVATLTGSPNWKNPKDLIELFSDQDFTQRSKQPAQDPYSLSSYQGLLYTSWSQLSVIYDFETRLPGVVAVDKSSFAFWIDKYRMTQLFTNDKVLSKFKPKWGNYKKTYSKKLVAKIIHDLGCDTFVIKPHGHFMGNGVIIVNKDELDTVIHYIITKKGMLATNKDPAYVAWKNDRSDSFIVEEFVTSDPIALPHLGNKVYQPTMRVAFLLVYNQHRHNVHFLGEYWKTPALAINEQGDFMHKNKDICEPPYYLAVDSSTKQQVQKELSVALPILHRNMLDFQPPVSEQLYTSPASTGVEMTVQEVLS